MCAWFGNQRSLMFRVMTVLDIPLRSRLWKNIYYQVTRSLFRSLSVRKSSCEMFVGSNQIISRLDSQSKLQMFLTVFRPPCWWSKGLHQLGGSIVGSINLRKTFWRISDVLEYAETQNLSKCLFYLSGYNITISSLYLLIISRFIFFVALRMIGATQATHVHM